MNKTLIDWNYLLEVRNQLVGKDIEFRLGGIIYRGPIQSYAANKDEFAFVLEWQAGSMFDGKWFFITRKDSPDKVSLRAEKHSKNVFLYEDEENQILVLESNRDDDKVQIDIYLKCKGNLTYDQVTEPSP